MQALCLCRWAACFICINISAPQWGCSSTRCMGMNYVREWCEPRKQPFPLHLNLGATSSVWSVFEVKGWVFGCVDEAYVCVCFVGTRPFAFISLFTDPHYRWKAKKLLFSLNTTVVSTGFVLHALSDTQTHTCALIHDRRYQWPDVICKDFNLTGK